VHQLRFVPKHRTLLNRGKLEAEAVAISRSGQGLHVSEKRQKKSMPATCTGDCDLDARLWSLNRIRPALQPCEVREKYVWLSASRKSCSWSGLDSSTFFCSSA
jgi:hypothetical protein